MLFEEYDAFSDMVIALKDVSLKELLNKFKIFLEAAISTNDYDILSELRIDELLISFIIELNFVHFILATSINKALVNRKSLIVFALLSFFSL
jgi:hypothetical protein